MHRDDFISNVTMIIWNNVKLHLLQTACCNALLPATLNCAFLQGHQQHAPRPPSSQNEYATSACATRHDTIYRAVVHASTTACVYLRILQCPLLTTGCTRLPSNSASSRGILLFEIGHAIQYIGRLAMPCVKSLTLTSRTASR
jgi:hypothetical protein